MIEKLKNIRDEYTKGSDWWNEISSEDKEAIDRGLKDIKEGKTHSHTRAKKTYEKYRLTPTGGNNHLQMAIFPTLVE